jgi:hypothetical protein
MRRPRRPAQDLRFTIDCLPRRSRTAMLEGINANEIIVGAYTDRDGGVCPMLAAHRRGGRTDLASFARAWDRYTRAGRRARKASEREVRTLRVMLEASLTHDEHIRGELADAVAELKAIKARRAAEEAAAEPAELEPVAPAPPTDRAPAPRDTGERDRSGELRRRPGWAWLRVFRRYDEYEAALDRLQRAEREAERREVERV